MKNSLSHNSLTQNYAILLFLIRFNNSILYIFKAFRFLLKFKSIISLRAYYVQVRGKKIKILTSCSYIFSQIMSYLYLNSQLFLLQPTYFFRCFCTLNTKMELAPSTVYLLLFNLLMSQLRYKAITVN